MLGHEYVLSETNLHGWVFVCECGEIGNVQTRAGYSGDESARARAVTEYVRDAARVDHRRHLAEIEAELVAAHAMALDSHTEYVRAVTPTVKRLGRWGNG